MGRAFIQGERVSYFSVGGALGRAFNLFGDEIAKYLLLGVVLMSPTVIYTLFFAPPAVGAPPLKLMQTAVQTGTLVGVANMILQVILQAAVLYGTLQQMQGHRFDLAESLKVGFSRIPAVLGVSILLGLAVCFGAILLLFPAFMILCAYYVAVPVCVMERPGIFQSLSRSGDLTRGMRWQIFGLLVIVFLLGIVAGGLVLVIARVVGGQVAGTVAQFVWQSVTSSFSAVLIAVVYHELRTSREGVNVGEIASVFD
jgi:hypothetical protein